MAKLLVALCLLNSGLLQEIQAGSNATLKDLCLSNENCRSSTSECLLNQCTCRKGWIEYPDEQTFCSYQLKTKLTAFLLSLFLGFFGVDWFYLSLANPFYIIAGICKLLTFGGLTIWWLIDWIRILANIFPDGNGYPLLDWN